MTTFGPYHFIPGQGYYKSWGMTPMCTNNTDRTVSTQHNRVDDGRNQVKIQFYIFCHYYMTQLLHGNHSSNYLLCCVNKTYLLE